MTRSSATLDYQEGEGTMENMKRFFVISLVLAILTAGGWAAMAWPLGERSTTPEPEEVALSGGPASETMTGLDSDLLVLQAPSRSEQELDAVLQDAVAAADRGEFELAFDLYRQVEISAGTGWHHWAGISGQVQVARRTGDFALALSVTDRVVSEQPKLAGLLAIWDGDTYWCAGLIEQAVAAYQLAADQHGADLVDGVPLGVTALGQLAALQAATAQHADAAATERRLLAEFGRDVNREAVLARALLFEAVAAGSVSAERVGDFLNPEATRPSTPVTLEAGRLVATPSRASVELRGAYGIEFVLKPADAELLEEEPSAAAPELDVIAACTPPAASDGFQNPIVYDPNNFGHLFMEYPDCCSGWHPGIDLNAPGDCSIDFKSVARGCVRDTASNGSDYGTVSVEHSYAPDPWVSTYIHGDYPPYVSVGQSVTKGQALGNVDDVGAASCHLHNEIREADHAYRDDAHNYSNTPLSRVGDWYQDPLPFIAAHRSYSWGIWADEGAFTRYGTWTYVTGVGDKDDMRWATTTSSLTNYARLTFTSGSSGTYDFKAFVPYNYSTSTAARYKLVKSSTGTVLWSFPVNQNPLLDAWVALPSASLSSSTTYYLEVASNTGESNKKVALDDFLILRRP